MLMIRVCWLQQSQSYEIRWDAKVPSDQLFQKHKDSLARALGNLFDKPSSFYYKKLKKARLESNSRIY